MGKNIIRPKVNKTISIVLLALIIFVTLPIGSAYATSNPATDNMSAKCETIATYSDDAQGSLNGVHIGETIKIANTTTFDAGTIYQDVLRRPDGSLYFATYLDLTTLSTTSNIAYNNSSLTLKIAGVNTTINPGTQPVIGTYIYDTITSGTSTTYRLYFPGDSTALLADPDGSGVTSVSLSNTTDFELSILATVLNIPANTNGTSFTVGKCQSGASTGAGSKSLPESITSVGVVEPEGQIAKSASDSTVAAGGIVTYELSIPLPLTGSDGLNRSDAFQLQIVDTLPPELTPVDSSDNLVLDGGSVPATLASQNNGIYNSGARTITYNINKVDAGTNFKTSYRAKVDPSLNPALLTPLTNNVVANAKSGPSSVASPRTYNFGNATATVVAGASVPSIIKNATLDVAAPNQLFQYEVVVNIPSGGELNNVTFSDKLEDGLEFVSLDSVSCSGCLGSDNIPGSNLSSYVSPSGWSRFGVYFGKMLPNASDRQINITYSARIKPSAQYSNSSPIPVGTKINNTAKIGYNISDRLGSVVPNMALPPNFDASDLASDEVEYNKPILTISNSNNRDPFFAPNLSDRKVRYTVTVENTGGVDANNVDIFNVTSNGNLYTDNSISDVTGGHGAHYLYDSNNPHFMIPTVAAGSSETFEFTMDVFGTILVDSFADVSKSSAIDLTSKVNSFNDAGGNYYSDPDPWGSTGWNISDKTSFKVHLPKLSVIKSRVSQSPYPIDGGPITWKISLVNSGDGYAEIHQLIDSLPNGFGIGSVLSPGNIEISNWGGNDYNFYSNSSSYIEVAPNSTLDIIYTTKIDGAAVGVHTTNVRASWYDGASRNGIYTSDWNEYKDLYHATSSANIELQRPTLSINKTPNESDNAYVLENTNTDFQIALTNTSNVDASNITLNDIMPNYLTYVSHSFSVSPADPSVTVDVDASDPHKPNFDINNLKPGATLLMALTTHQHGTPPTDEQDLVNTAIASSHGTLNPVSDTGQVTYIPNIINPSATKSASPNFGAPGTAVTYTEEFTSATNSIDIFDLSYLDVIPDGIDFDSYGSITCVSGPCATMPTVLNKLDNADGSTTIGWYLGDQAAFGPPSVYRVTYNAVIADTFQGTGTPAAGTQVQDGLAEPFINRVRPHYNLSDVLLSSPLNVPSNTSGIWVNRGANAVSSFDVRTPSVTPIKTITNQTEFSWTSGPIQTGKGYAFNPGDRIDYRIEVKNTGSAPAFDVLVNDDMALGELQNVIFDSLPAGATIVDAWSSIDPDFSLRLSNPLASGDSVFITYHGFAKHSPDLLHQMSSFNQDVSLIRNSVSTPEFHSQGAGLPGNKVYTNSVIKRVDAYVYTPAISLTASCYEIPEKNKTATANFAFSNNLNSGSPVRNVHTPGVPNDITKGAATVTNVEIRLPDSVSYVANSMNVDGYAYTSTPGFLVSIPDPIVTINPDGTTTLTIDTSNMNNVRLHSSESGARFVFEVRAKVDEVYASGGISVGIQDTSGSPTRGTNVGDTYTYSQSGDYGCGGGYNLDKRPEPSIDTNQFKFFPGETGKYWGSFSKSGPSQKLTGVRFVDTMPLGVTYLPNTATFNVDGTSVTSASITETINVLPSGQQEITWENLPLGAGATYISFEIPVVLDSGTSYIGSNLINNIVSFADQELYGGCVIGACSLNDTGTLYVEDPSRPTLEKYSDKSKYSWGDTVDWTVKVSIPANKSYEDLLIFDDLLDDSVSPYDLGEYAETVNYLTQTCTSGCSGPGDMLSPTPMPAITSATPTPRTTQLAWYLGDVAPASVNRELEFTYRVQLRTLDDISSINPTNVSNLNFASIDVRNIVHFTEYKGSNGPAPIYDAFSQDWFTQFQNYDSSATISHPIDKVIVPISIEMPWLQIGKSCVNTKGLSDKEGVPLSPTSPGSVNVICTIQVENKSNAPAYNIVVRDTPSTDGDSYFNNPHTVDWQVLHTNGSHFAPTTTWAASGNTYVEWASDSYDALNPGETWEFVIAARADGFDEWPDAILNPGEEKEDNYGIGFNSASLEPWTNAPNSSALISQGTKTKEIRLLFKQSSIYVGKVAERYSFETDPKYWFYDYAMQLEESDMQDDFGPTAYLNDPKQFYVDVMVTNVDGYDVISVSDTLPYGFTYANNSAKLISAIHPSGYSEEDSIITDHVIPNPAISQTSLTSCPQGTWQTGDPNNSDSNEGGDQLNWTFLKSGGAPSNSLWDPAKTLLNTDEVPFSMNRTFEHMYRIAYQAIPTQAAQDCVTTEAALDRFENDVELNAHLLTTGATHTSSFNAAVMMMDFLDISKTPVDGFSPDSANSSFDINVRWSYIQNDYVETWDINSREGAANRTVITDTFYDRGLYVPGSSTVEIIDPFGVTHPFTMTETSNRIDANNIQVTYELEYIPGGLILPEFCSEENPFCLSATNVHIKVPFFVPLDTLDGTQYTNSASVHVYDTEIKIDGGYGPENHLEWVDGPADARITVINPSAPVVPIKTATLESAIGDVIDYEVKVVLDPNKVWFDLAYKDILPNNVTFMNYGTPSCKYQDGTTCFVSPINLSPSVSGGVTSLAWYFGDLGGESKVRTVTIPFTARLHSGNIGDNVINSVLGYSNDENKISGTPVSLPSSSTYDFASATATAQTKIVGPVLLVEKSTSTPGPLAPGAQASYSVTVTNTGERNAYEFLVVDTPNAAIEDVKPSGANAIYATKGWTSASPDVRWFVPELSSGSSITFEYSGSITNDYASLGLGFAENVVKVDSYYSQPVSNSVKAKYGPVSDEIAIPLSGPRISLEHYASSCSNTLETQQVSYGQASPWCAILSNVGDNDAVNVQLRLLLPPGFTYVPNSSLITIMADEPDVITTLGSSQLLTWDVGTVTPGQVITFDYSAIAGVAASLTSKSITTAISTRADGSAVPFDSQGYVESNDAYATLAFSGLEVSKNPPYQELGFLPNAGTASWTINISNPGNANTRNVSVKDSLPAPLTYVPGSFVSTCVGVTEDSVVPTGSRTDITWSIGDLAPGASCDITIVGNHPGGTLDLADIVNDVEANADFVNTVADQARAYIYAPASLAGIAWNDDDRDGIRDASESLRAGITVELIDRHGNVVGTRITDASGNYSFAGLVPQNYTLRFSTLPSGRVVTFKDRGSDDSVDSDVDQTSLLTDVVGLQSGQDLTGVDIGVGIPQVDVGIVKNLLTGGEKKIGDLVDWKLVVTNNGPVKALAPLKITDELPSNLEFVSVTPESGLNCTNVGNNVTCEMVQDLAVGQTIAVVVKTRIVSAGTISNVGRVSSSIQLETNYENNTSSAAFVLGESKSITNQQLPTTGSNSKSMLYYALGIMFVGFFLAFAFKAKRRIVIANQVSEL